MRLPDGAARVSLLACALVQGSLIAACASSDAPAGGPPHDAGQIVDALWVDETGAPATDDARGVATSPSADGESATDAPSAAPADAVPPSASGSQVSDAGGTSSEGSRLEDAARDRAADGSTLASSRYAVGFADSIMRRWPDARNITGVTRGWDYNNGIVLRGMAEVYGATRDPRYLAYIKAYVDTFVDGAGKLYVDAAKTRPIEDEPHSLDVIQPAQLLVLLAQQPGADRRYAAAAGIVRDMFAKFPVNAWGGFWHKATYPNEMWLDGIYMAEPFLARLGALTPSCGATCADTPVAQATLIGEHTRLGSGLFAHGWDADHNATWCTAGCAAAGGRSNEVWGRATGWYAMALVEVLAALPAAHAGRASLSSLLMTLAQAVKAAQDPATGLWCEVIDKCNEAGNWTESSGSAMLIYALKRGVDVGALDASYLAVAERAFRGLVANKIGSDAMGPTITDVADGSSILGTYADYVAIAKRTNSYHGLCAVQLAAAAMEYDPVR